MNAMILMGVAILSGTAFKASGGSAPLKIYSRPWLSVKDFINL